MSDPVVYVVQFQHHWDPHLGKLVPRFDLSDAERLGRLVYLLSPSAKPGDPRVVPELCHRLSQYRDGDHLLLIGSPVLIGIAFAIAARANDGRVSALQWSGKLRRYTAIESDLAWADEHGEEHY